MTEQRHLDAMTPASTEERGRVFQTQLLMAVSHAMLHNTDCVSSPVLGFGGVSGSGRGLTRVSDLPLGVSSPR